MAGLLFPAVAVAARAATTERVSISSAGRQGDHDSGTFGVAVSAAGRFVAFTSDATNFVPHDTDGRCFAGDCGPEVFVRDRQAGTTERVSVSSRGRRGKRDSGGSNVAAVGRGLAIWGGAGTSSPLARRRPAPSPATPTAPSTSSSASGARPSG